MEKYEDLSCDENGIPLVKELTKILLSIMDDKEAWELNELVNKVSQELDMPMHLRNMRSKSKTHYLVWNDRVKKALYQLLENKKIKRIGRGIYKKVDYRANIYSAFQNSDFDKLKRGIANSNLIGKLYINNLNRALAMPSVLKYAISPFSRASGFNRAIVDINKINKSNILKKALVPKNNLNNFALAKSINDLAGISRFGYAGAIPRKDVLGVFNKNLKSLVRPNISWSKLVANSNMYSRFLYPGERVQKYVSNIGSIYRNVTDVNDRISTVADVVQKATNINFNSLNLGFASDSVDYLSDSGWCISTDEDIRFLLINAKLSDKEKLMKKEKTYTNHKILNMISTIIDKFTTNEAMSGDSSIYKRHVKELTDILAILQDDFSKYYLFYGNLISICEYAFYQEMNRFFKNKKNYLNLTNIKDLNKEMNNTIEQRNNITLYAIKFITVFKVMKNFWKPKQHDTFGRDTVQHGFWGLDNENKYIFAKVTKLLFSILNLDDPSKIFG